MGCVPSKGEALLAPVKSEYQHTLPATGKSGSSTSGKLQTAVVPGTEQIPATAVAAQENIHGFENGKTTKKSSLDNGWVTDGAGELTGTFSTDINKTEITEALSSELIAVSATADASALVAQLDNETTLHPAVDTNLNGLPDYTGMLAGASSNKQMDKRVPEIIGGSTNQNSFEHTETSASSQEHLAAIVIQSAYRERLFKRGTQQNRSNGAVMSSGPQRPQSDAASESTTSSKLLPSSEKKQPEEEIDIDLKDPDVEKAALKIQGAFKGHKMKRNSTRSPEAREAPVL